MYVGSSAQLFAGCHEGLKVQFSSGGLGSSWTITDCWQISFPCDCMSEVLIFMLAVGQRLFLVPKDLLQVFSMGPIDSLQYANLLSPNNQERVSVTVFF